LKSLHNYCTIHDTKYFFPTKLVKQSKEGKIEFKKDILIKILSFLLWVFSIYLFFQKKEEEQVILKKKDAQQNENKV
jgi:hypothetical protein